MPRLHDTNSLINNLKAKRAFDREMDKTSIISVIEFPSILNENVGILFPKTSTFNLSIDIALKLRKAGTPVKATDIIIAALGIERNYPIITNDKHFTSIQAVDSRLTIHREESDGP